MKMKKALLMAAAILLISPFAQNVLAASARCVVTQVEGHTIRLECKQEPTGFTNGDAVKIKSAKKERIEGC